MAALARGPDPQALACAIMGPAADAASGSLFEEMSAEMGLKHVEELRLRKVLRAAVVQAGSSVPPVTPIAATEEAKVEAMVPVLDMKTFKKRSGFSDVEEELMRLCKAMKTARGAKAPAGLRPCPAALMAATAA
jgi:hypothetical protein